MYLGSGQKNAKFTTVKVQTRVSSTYVVKKCQKNYNLQVMRRLLVHLISIDSSKNAPKLYHIPENKQTVQY